MQLTEKSTLKARRFPLRHVPCSDRDKRQSDAPLQVRPRPRLRERLSRSHAAQSVRQLARMVSERPSTWIAPQARQSNRSIRLMVEEGEKSHHSHPMHHEQAGTSLVFGVKPGRADWGRCLSSVWQQSRSRWSKREQGRDGYACQKSAKQAHLVGMKSLRPSEMLLQALHKYAVRT